ncbi:MAG: hypothetical protein ABSG53_18570 [Thermoguttaceae bacterium]
MTPYSPQILLTRIIIAVMQLQSAAVVAPQPVPVYPRPGTVIMDGRAIMHRPASQRRIFIQPASSA